MVGSNYKQISNLVIIYLSNGLDLEIKIWFSLLLYSNDFIKHTSNLITCFLDFTAANRKNR